MCITDNNRVLRVTERTQVQYVLTVIADRTLQLVIYQPVYEGVCSRSSLQQSCSSVSSVTISSEGRWSVITGYCTSNESCC